MVPRLPSPRQTPLGRMDSQTSGYQPMFDEQNAEAQGRNTVSSAPPDSRYILLRV